VEQGITYYGSSAYLPVQCTAAIDQLLHIIMRPINRTIEPVDWTPNRSLLC